MTQLHNIKTTLFMAMAMMIIAISLTAPIVTASLSAFGQEVQYTCPMHPHYISDRPGTCPICGMDLVAIEMDDHGQDADHASHDAGMNDDRMAITIDPQTMQNMGVRVEKAEMARFGTATRSYGNVMENIRLQFDISARVEGWVEDLQTKAAGDQVLKGDMLFKLYSPALISAQQDFLGAIQTGVAGRIESAARRLASLGMQDQVIDDVKKRRKSFQQVPYYAQSDGVISQINIREGSYVSPGMNMMMVQNYDSIWVDVSIAEQDIAFITPDTIAHISLPALGIKDVMADIDYIYPTIDQATRTGRVRLVLDNPQGALKPGAYADVEFETGLKQRLSIPSDAVLKSKDGDFVVVALGEGRFQPRKVLTGLTYKSRTEILEGLTDQDDIVVSGQFLLDSESALRESFRKMQDLQKPLQDLSISQDQLAMIDHLLDAAIYLQKELYAGRMPRVQFIAPAVTLNDHLMPIFRGTKLQYILQDAKTALADIDNHVTDRQWQQSLNDLVIALQPWITQGKPAHYQAQDIHIFMAHMGDGKANTYWIQQGQTPQNPYHNGHVMAVEYEIEYDDATNGVADHD